MSGAEKADMRKDVIFHDGHEYVRDDIIPQVIFDNENKDAVHMIATRTPFTHHEVKAIAAILGYPRIRAVAKELSPPTLRSKLRNWQPFAFLKP